LQLIDIYEFIHARVVGVLDTFTNPMSFLSPLPLAIAALISLIVILSRQNSNIRTSERAPILSQLFPSRIIFHSSAKIDLWIIIINKGVFFFVPLLGTVLVFYFSQSLSSLTETRGQSSSGGFLWMIAFTVYSTLVWDFLASFSHYLKHKVPFLWEFHKVHHSAQVLTPLTALRRHPFEAFFSAVLVGVGLAISTMAWILVTGMPGLSLQIGGVMMTIYLWRVLGYNIRHSHLWISYGGFWNKIFISPAHHHIHHSNSVKRGRLNLVLTTMKTKICNHYLIFISGPSLWLPVISNRRLGT